MTDLFNTNSITPANWESMFAVQAKPLTAYAAQIHLPEGFTVETTSGWAIGVPGDYLIIYPDGTRDLVPQEQFNQSWQVIARVKP